MTQQRTKWKWVLLSMAFCVSLTLEPPNWGASPEAEGEGDEPHRILMHLNSGDEKVQRGALNNIKNLYQDLGPREPRR